MEEEEEEEKRHSMHTYVHTHIHIHVHACILVSHTCSLWGRLRKEVDMCVLCAVCCMS